MASAAFHQIFTVFLLFLTVNSQNSNTPKLGLYKLQAEDGKGRDEPNLLVAEKFARKDYIYLYQFNRTSSAPTQAALDQFIEGLLLLMKTVKFHRIPNQFFLGSQHTGTVPFIQYKGKYFDGVENILAFFRQTFKKQMKTLETFEKDEEVRKFALDFSFNILMKDRSRRLNNWTSKKSKEIIPSKKKFVSEIEEIEIEGNPPSEMEANAEMEGLDFMLYDQGIREQMLPAIPGQLGKTDVSMSMGKFTVKEFSRKFLTAYFDATEEKGTGEIKFEAFKDKENVTELNAENWDEFEKAMEAYITKELYTVLISDKNSWEKKLKKLVHENKYDGQSYKKIDEADLYTIFIRKLDELEILSRLNQSLFLGGDNPSSGDMALFSILEQFFHTKLNILEFKNLFQPLQLNENDRKKLHEKSAISNEIHAKKVIEIRSIFSAFCTNMKSILWGREYPYRFNMLTRKPWPLNYEKIGWTENYPNKFDGPYVIEFETDELNGLLEVGATNSMDNTKKGKTKKGNERNLLEEIVANVIKTKENQLSGKMESQPKWYKKIFRVKGKPLDENKLQEMMLAETVAYICKGKKCPKKFGKKLTGIPDEIKQETRKVVYETIVAYNDRVVRDKVTMETERAAEMSKKNPGNAAKYSSEPKIDDEN